MTNDRYEVENIKFEDTVLDKVRLIEILSVNIKLFK